MSKKFAKYRRKKTAKSKQRQPRSRTSLGAASQWPMLECLISQDWQETTELCQVLVARQSPATGEVAVGGFIVDLACLGVKNALANLYSSAAVYRREYRQHVTASQPMMDCDLDLAAKVIEEGTNYARSLGFKPHKDAAMALKILGDAHPENCAKTIPLGKDGKPLFINGPYDNVERIIRILDRNVGRGNYDVVILLGDPTEEWLDDDL